MSKKIIELLDRCDSLIRALAYGDRVSAERFKQSTDLIADIQLLKSQIEEITSNDPYIATLSRAESGDEFLKLGRVYVKKS